MRRRAGLTAIVAGTLVLVAAPGAPGAGPVPSAPDDSVPISTGPHDAGPDGVPPDDAGAQGTLPVDSRPVDTLPADAPELPRRLDGSGRALPTMWVAGPAGAGASFVAPDFAAASDDPEAAAWEYFDTFADLYGFAAPHERLAVVAVTPTAAGTVVRFEQSLGGLPVYAGGFTVTVSEATVTAVTGLVLADAEVAAALLDADGALARAAGLEPGLAPAPDTLRPVVYSALLDGANDAGGDGVNGGAPPSAEPLPAWEVEIVGDDWTADQLVVLSAVDGAVLVVEPLSLAAESWDIYVSAGGDFDHRDARRVIETRGSTTRGTVPVPASASAADATCARRGSTSTTCTGAPATTAPTGTARCTSTAPSRATTRTTTTVTAAAGWCSVPAARRCRAWRPSTSWPTSSPTAWSGPPPA